MEVFKRDNTVLELLRCSLAILQGSWFYQVKSTSGVEKSGLKKRIENTSLQYENMLQIGFVLFPLNGEMWELDKHDNIMFITMCFCWHYAVALLVVGICYCGVFWWVDTILDESKSFHCFILLILSP